MRRTKFNNVVDLAAKRQADKSEKRRAERRKRKAKPERYRIGLVVRVDEADLTPVERSICELIGFTKESYIDLRTRKAIYALIGKLLEEDERSIGAIRLLSPNQQSDGGEAG